MEVYPEKEATTPPKPVRWMKLVNLGQFMWELGTIPADLGCRILVLVSKGNTDNLGIGLLEVFWNMMESIIDTHIKKSVTFHDVFHGFFFGSRTGTAIMDLKLAQ